jgi:hypothetical protein
VPDVFAVTAIVLLLALLCAFLFVGDHWGYFRGEPEQKAGALLRQWLSPAQLTQYERTRRFEVEGSDTGRRYRIHRHAQLNVEELDERGDRVTFWCFAPEGNLPVDDIMLAQKIALETDERAALEIARRGRPNYGL